MSAPQPFSIRRIADAPTVPCPCGQSTRIVTQADGLGCSFHITHIFDSVQHYHKCCAEIYYILEGLGKMSLDDTTVNVEPGMVITIPPGVRHRLYSDAGVKSIVVAVPAFNPDDEHFD